MRNRNTKIDFTIELEYGKQTVEYEVHAEVSPYDPGRTYGPPEDCYPPEGNDVEVKEVYYIERQNCPNKKKSMFTKDACELGSACPKCYGRGYVEVKHRRPELDDLISDEECVEKAQEERDNEPDYPED